MFGKKESTWRKARRRLVRKVGVNILAKIWIRSKQLKKFKLSYLIRNVPARLPQYRVLADRDIRLLRLKPGHSISTIECTFSHTNVDSPEEYFALSYTWGKDTPSVPIMLNGIATLVTSNLYLALLHFRERGFKTLWVDYLCINQKDLTERASQVSMMKDVYCKAHLVLIWLGESNALTERAFEEFNDLFESVDYDNRIPMENMKRESVNYPERWRAICEVLYRPWFRRVWIIQEVLCARHALVLCGSDIIELNVFLQVINSIYQADMLRMVLSYHPNRREMHEGPMKVAIEQITFLLKAKCDTLDYLQRARFEPSLLNYLGTARWAEATDLRDKVYGILSMAHVGCALGHRQYEGESWKWVPFTVDYTVPAPQVFINVAKAIITSSRTLNVLRFTRYTADQASHLPSWAPDWADTKAHPNNDYNNFEPMYQHRKNTSWRPYNSNTLHDEITQYCQPYFRFKEGDILRVRGIQCDTIASVSAHAHPYHESLFSHDPQDSTKRELLLKTEQYFDALTDWVEDSVQKAMTHCSPYPSEEIAVWDALWTLLNGRCSDANERTPASPEEMLQDFAQAKNAFAKAKPYIVSGDLEFQDPLLHIAANVGVHYYGTCLSRLPKSSVACRGKKFAVTGGKLMGLVPEEAAAGDLVCFLYGIEQAIILRECGQERFLYIGIGNFQGMNFDDAIIDERIVVRGTSTGKRTNKASLEIHRRGEPSLYIVLRDSRVFDLV